MSLKIEPEHLRAIYTMYRKLPPFNKWDLPEPSRIEFLVDDDDEIAGELTVEPITLRVSTAHQSHFANICKTVAHEMIHLKLYIQGKTNFDKHDNTFQLKFHSTPFCDLRRILIVLDQ